MLTTCSANSFCTELGSHKGTITQIAAFPHDYGKYDENQKGRLTLFIEGLPPGCGDGLPRVVIGVDHPMYDSVLSIALLAKASETKVSVAYFKECTLRENSWDLANITIE